MIEETQVLSLADLAGLDVTEIKEVASVRVPAGQYDLLLESAAISEVEDKDEEGDSLGRAKGFSIRFTFLVQTVHSIADKSIEPETVLNRKLVDSVWVDALDGTKTLEGVGRVRSLLRTIGAANEGVLGGNGEVIGCLDNAAGVVAEHVKISYKKNARGFENTKFTYKKPATAK